MHVVVVGAGIIGVCTAYHLRRAGFDVTVIERNTGVAQETSFANAGMVCPSYVAPWAQPGMPTKVLRYLLSSEAPLSFRPNLDLATWRWMRRWLRECEVERFKLNKARMQRLAYYSRDQLHEIRARHAIDYEQRNGFLQLFRSEKDLAASEPSRRFLETAQIPHKLLTAEECRVLEPALHPATPLTAGLQLPDDETGNCAFFAHRLKDIAIADGVDFRFGETARSFNNVGGRIASIVTDQGELAADSFVVAGGIDSLRLLAPLGIKVPMIAVKGYSATAPLTASDQAPFVGVMDESYKVAITRMGNRLRIAGTAEIGTTGMKLREAPLRTLMKVVRDWFPYAAAYRDARFWIGARPMLPDGPPCLGASPISNLYLNLGHGSTGWTMSCGSGRVLADLVAGKTPEIDMDGLGYSRFAAATKA